MGKTKVALDFIYSKKYTRPIVVAPIPLLREWVKQAGDHRPELKMNIVTKTNPLKEGEVNLIGYRRFQLQSDLVSKFNPDFIALDEGLIKNPSSKRTVEVQNITLDVPERILMTGTLINNTPTDVFGPIRFLEPALVGYKFTKFRDRYSIRNPKVPYYDCLGYRDTEEISEIIAACCIVMKKEDWMNYLPKKIYEEIQIPMPEFLRTVYREIRNNYITEINGHVFAYDNPLSVFGALTQVTCGFLKKDDQIFDLGEHPKLEKMVEIITEKREKAIVWFNYTHEGNLAEEYLRKAGISYLRVDGKTKSVFDSVSQFNSTGIQVLLSQSKVLNYGQTIMGNDKGPFEFLVSQTVRLHIFLSESWSAEVSRQQEDRTHRIGAKSDSIYIRLLMSPVDKVIREAIKEKRDIDRTIMMRACTRDEVD